MKKMFNIVLSIFVVFLVSGFLLSLFFEKLGIFTPKMMADKKLFLGPYSCGGKNLTIDVDFRINKLEGVKYITNLSVKHGNILFKEAASSPYREKYEENVVKEMGDHFDFKYQEYLEKMNTGVNLPSQEELIERGIRPDESGAITLLAIGSTIAQSDMQDFSKCFYANKKDIYDQISNGKVSPMPVWFHKAYLIKEDK